MSEDLKPCPFCGGRVYLEEDTDNFMGKVVGWMIVHDDDGEICKWTFTNQAFRTQEDAIAAWNARAPANGGWWPISATTWKENERADLWHRSGYRITDAFYVENPWEDADDQMPGFIANDTVYVMEEITHWMPLPQPPAEKDE